MKSKSDDTQEVRKLIMCAKRGCVQNMYHARALVHVCNITCLVIKRKLLHAPFSLVHTVTKQSTHVLHVIHCILREHMPDAYL